MNTPKIDPADLASKMEASLPITTNELHALGAHLSRSGRIRCDGTLAQTIAFLHERKLPVDDILYWLRSNGAFCDCEVCFNLLLSR